MRNSKDRKRQPLKWVFPALIVISLLAIHFAENKAFASPGPGLFTEVIYSPNFDVQTKMQKLKPGVLRSRYVVINFDQLSGVDLPEGADSVVLNLFEDVSVVATKLRVEKRAAGRYTWVGRIQSAEISQVVLVVENGTMAGNIVINGQFFQVRGLRGEIHSIQEIDQRLFPEEASPLPAEPIPDIPGTQYFSPQADDGSVIDVLVVYTAAVANASQNILAEIQLAIDETNQSYANSEIIQRVRLAHAEQVEYSETGSSSTDLVRLRNPSDGFMDNVHALRNTYAADLVSLWVETLDACGISYLMSTVSSTFEAYAFSVIDRSCATGYYSFGHEMGHVMGAHHDRYVAPEKGAYTYSHGYVYTPGRWRTIMAYNNMCVNQGFTCTRIPYWSNPNVNYGDTPTGVNEGFTNSANNALTLNNTRTVVANFRQLLKFVISDFNGDGKTDVAVYETATGFWNFHYSGGNTYGFDAIGVGGGSQWKPVPGDYDGDKKADVVVYDTTNGWWLFHFSSGAWAYDHIGMGGTGFVPVPGDYDGDGTTDIAVYQQATGDWFFKYSSGGYGYFNLGGPGKIPVVADFDGDGKTDKAVYETGTGYWNIYYSKSSTYGFDAIGVGGGSQWTPVPGDYDGDKKADVAVYDTINGWWLFHMSSGSWEYDHIGMGGTGYTPVPGDYDGDGITDLAVYQESTGNWFFKYSSGTYGYDNLGGPGKVPVR